MSSVVKHDKVSSATDETDNLKSAIYKEDGKLILRSVYLRDIESNSLKLVANLGGDSYYLIRVQSKIVKDPYLQLVVASKELMELVSKSLEDGEVDIVTLDNYVIYGKDIEDEGPFLEIASDARTMRTGNISSLKYFEATKDEVEEVLKLLEEDMPMLTEEDV
jgi:hypothetical protein